MSRCPIDPNVITKFKSNEDGSKATAFLKSMFKFPEGSEVHIQCDIIQCIGKCPDDELCTVSIAEQVKGGRSLNEKLTDDNMLLASTTVFVLDPADAPCKLNLEQRSENSRSLIFFLLLFF